MNEDIKILKEKVKNLKVLYSEDEEEMRIGTELFLKKFFTTVETATDGLDGLEKFKNGSYDIVFTDILMPKMDGLEMLKSLKKLDDKLFTVTLTASEVREEDIIKNCDLYFRKPISYDNMITTLKEIIVKFNL